MINIYKSFDDIPHDPTTILTVGTFDGVHLGHRKILRRLISIGKKDKMRSLLITIHPHPQIVLNKPDREPIKLLTSIEERMDLLEDFGVNNVLILEFNEEFSKTPPERFVKDLLIGRIGMKKMLIGYDHMFGKNREGDIDLLLRMAPMNGFGVERIQAYSEREEVISSTKIRNLIKDCNIQLANEYLGYEYFLKGKVVVGDKRGAKIGYPTANVESLDPNKLLPGRGVYFVEVEIEESKFYGMANVGYRPTFKSENEKLLEVHIFDFDEDIYNKDIRITFKNYLRPEKKFPSADELLLQLKEDKIKSYDLISYYVNSKKDFEK